METRTKTYLHIDDKDIEPLLNIHREAIGILNVPDVDELYLKLDNCEIELANEIKKLIEQAYRYGCVSHLV